MNLKERIAAGHTLVGTFVSLPSPGLVELIGRAGLDFCILDTEHGPPSMMPELEELVRACGVTGVAAIVRISANRPELINQALDTGADAVMVPQVRTAEDARQAVTAARFPPLGQRGLSSITRAASYGSEANYTERANDRIVVIIQIETPEAIANLEEIMAVRGINAFFLGAVDLASAMGYPLQTGHAAVQEVANEAVGRLTSGGWCVGAIVGSYGPASELVRKRVRILATSTALVSKAYADWAHAMRDEARTDYPNVVDAG